MLSVRGIYEKGEITLTEKIPTERKVEVIVTFLENTEEERRQQLNLDQFSFKKSRELLKHYKGSLSDEIIAERRSFV
jgi:hypothetical protein